MSSISNCVLFIVAVKLFTCNTSPKIPLIWSCIIDIHGWDAFITKSTHSMAESCYGHRYYFIWYNFNFFFKYVHLHCTTREIGWQWLSFNCSLFQEELQLHPRSTPFGQYRIMGRWQSYGRDHPWRMPAALRVSAFFCNLNKFY